MNDDRRFERDVASVFAETAPPRGPDDLLENVFLTTGPMRPRPRWLARIKEPPMRYTNSIAVGSPTARVAAVLVATLLLIVAVAGAGAAGSRLLAAGPIVVAQDGSGAFTTINEAIDEAQDGDSILIRPGTYSEWFTITNDISLSGEDRDSVIIEAGEANPMYENYWFGQRQYSILIDGSEAEVSNLTVRILGGDIKAFTVKGGAPLIHDVTVDGQPDGSVVYIHDGSAAMVKDSRFEQWVMVEEQSPATIEGNTIEGMIRANTNAFPTGGEAVIRDNRVNAIRFVGSAFIEGNDLRPPEGEDDGNLFGISEEGSSDGWVIKDNALTGFQTAIFTAGTGTIEGNELTNNRVAIMVGSSESMVKDNRIRGGDTGIALSGSPTLVDNTVEGLTGRGIVVGMNSSPTLIGNMSCDNGTNLYVSDTAEPVIDDTNEICEDLPTE